jgi:hypothetical protein
MMWLTENERGVDVRTRDVSEAMNGLPVHFRLGDLAICLIFAILCYVTFQQEGPVSPRARLAP